MKIIIIGAGIAGMSAAGLLSKAGNEVTVIERENRILGRAGTIRGEDIEKSSWLSWQKRQSKQWIARTSRPLDELINDGYFNGYELDLAFHSWAHGQGGRPNQILKYLGADLEFWSQEPIGFHRGKTFPLPLSAEKFLGLTQTGWVDGAEIEKLTNEFLLPYMTKPITEYAPLNSMPLRPFLNQFTDNEFIHDIFEAIAVILGTVMDPYNMPTGEFLRLLRNIIETQENSGLPKGGMCKVSDEFLRILTENGATVILEAEAKKILVDNNAAKGVVFEKNGQEETLMADIVISNIPVQRFIASKLLEEKYMPGKFLLNSRRTIGGGGVCGFFGLDSGKAIPEAYRNSLYIMPVIFPQWEGDFEWDPRLCAQMETASDPGKAPEGKDLLSSFTILSHEAMYIPRKTDKIIDGHLQGLEAMFPGFLDSLDWYYFTVVPFGVGLEMSIRGLDLRYRDVKLPGLKNFYMVGDTVDGWGCGMDGAVLSSILVSDEITGLDEMFKIVPQWLGPLE